jgi:hypothetical protein
MLPSNKIATHRYLSLGTIRLEIPSSTSTHAPPILAPAAAPRWGHLARAAAAFDG